MNELDKIDRIWRDGFAVAADRAPAVSDPHGRVAQRVRHLRRVRSGLITAATAIVVAAVAIGVGAMTRHVSSPRVATNTPTVIDVADAPGGALKIDFPGRTLSNNPPRSTLDSPPQITVRAGRFEFVVHGDSAGHALVLDGVPGFKAEFEKAATTITQDVYLSPGRYLLHCTIPGHAQAGEEAMIVVT